ncbi:MAG: DUF4012 domain-containing protein [Patescibacteria group bacterium]
MAEEINKNNQEKIKKGPGRPKKILSPEEILALKNKKQRGRGRPKKQRTEEEILAIKLSKERGKGRPKKGLCPREEWFLKFAPKREKGRPKKNEILSLSLPQILFKNKHTEKKENVDTLLPQILYENKESKNTEKKMPQFSWAEFKEKIPTIDLTEDYIFPIIEQSQESKVRFDEKVATSPRRVSVREVEEPSKYIIDLRARVQAKPKQEDVYAWNASPKEFSLAYTAKDLSLLNFDTPADLEEEGGVIKFTRVEKNKHKKKSRKVSLISAEHAVHSAKPVQTKELALKPSLVHSALVSFGKFLYFTWQAITAPFRFLDFIIDRTLKIIWRSLFASLKLVYKIIYTILNYNFLYIKKLFQSAVAVISGKGNLNWALVRPLATFVFIALIVVVPIWAIGSFKKAEKVKGDVLGVSVQGIDYLNNAVKTISDSDFQSAGGQFSLAKNSFQKAQSEFENLGAVNGWLLQLVPKVNDGQKLLRAGELTAIVGGELSKAFGIFNNNIDQSISGEMCQSLPGQGQKCVAYAELNLTSRLSYVKNILDSQQSNLDELLYIISRIDVSSVPKEYREKLLQVQENLSDVGVMSEKLNGLLDFLLEFLGADKPKRYLVVFQNSREIRPTGGFMGSFALIDVYQGNVQKIDIPGGGLYDLKGSNQVLVAAPKPLQIFSPAWQIWNANWFPDWPTSAKKIMWFYENNTGGSTVDGVFALNQDVVAELLALTGPIEMADYEKTLDANNFTNEVQMAVEYEYDKEQNRPKQIIADLAPKLLQNVIDMDSNTFLKAFLVLNKSLAQEKVLFYFNNENMQKQVQSFGWAGSMKETGDGQDYLMVIHNNISGGKSEHVINNILKHKVEIADDGSLIVTVSLLRKHNGTQGELFEQDNNVDYVRFYTPKGSKFISASGFNFNPDYLFKYATVDYENLAVDKTLSEIESGAYIDEPTRTRVSQEFNKTVFGNWIQVAPGQEVFTEIKYQLPFKFEVEDRSNNFKKWVSSLFNADKQFKYSLVVEKHPGMDAIDFDSQLVLPQDFKVNKVIKSNNFNQVNTAEFSSSLLEDGYYGIVFSE